MSKKIQIILSYFSFYSRRNVIKVFLINFLLIFNLISCKKDVKIQRNVIDITDVYEQEPQKVNLSSIAAEITYIPLQTDSISFLGKVEHPIDNNIKFLNNSILIKDRSDKLILFDRSGRFLAIIGNRGKGPGEYMDIGGFTFFQDSLVVISARLSKKLLFYNLDGNFVKEISLDFESEGLFSFNNHLISVNSIDSRKASGYHNLNIFNKEGMLKGQLIHRPYEKILDEKLGWSYWSEQPDLRHSFSLGGNKTFWEHGFYSSRDTVWEIKKDFTIEPKHIIYFGGERTSIELFYKDIARSHSPKGNTDLDGYIETQQYFFFEVFRKDRRIRIYRTKVNQKNTSLRFDWANKKGKHSSFYNDMDAGLHFWPDGVVSENKVFQIVEGYKIREHLSEINNNSSYDKAARERLEKLVANSQITDNPILMIVTLK